MKQNRIIYKKDKVLIISALPPPYHGVTIFNYNLLNSKLIQLYKVIHLDISDKRGIKSLGRWDFVNVYLGMKNLIQLVVLLLREKPRIVYLGIAQNKAYLRDGLFIVISKFFSRSKIIVHAHGIFKAFYDSTNIFMKAFIDATLRYTDIFIVLGDSLKYSVEKWARQIEVVPNGLDFNLNLERRNKKEIIVSYMSNLSKNKGIIDFLTAAKLVLKKYPNVSILFAGEFSSGEKEAKEYITETMKEDSIKEKIKLTGFLQGEEKNRFFADTDIFVFPTHYDSFGLVLLEAMASGCAIITTRVGVIPEIIIDGESGIIVDKQNPKRLAEAIMYLIDNPLIIRKLGIAAQSRYRQHYTLDKNIERLAQAFDRSI